jgi:hypothetical protein
VNGGILVAGEPDQAHLALLLGLRERFGRAVGAEDEVGIVVVDDFVDLPDVQIVGAEAAQRFVEH